MKLNDNMIIILSDDYKYENMNNWKKFDYLPSV